MQDANPTPMHPAAFNEYNQKLQLAGLLATRKAAGIPTDVAFHRSMDSQFAEGLDSFSERVLTMTNRLLALVSTADQTQTSRGKGKGKLEGQDDVLDHFQSLVVASVDQLLERTDICLDEFLGKNKAPAIAINPPITSDNKKPTSKQPVEKGRPEPVIQHAAHLAKPQLQFSRKPDNSDAPWYPSLSHKYNAKVPLGHVYTDVGLENTSGIISNHPYRYEITHLSHPPKMFEPCTPVFPPPLEDTQSTWVDTAEGFQKMLSKLKKAKEIAVDLEHHSYRSYSGFLCLMQITDREEDWVVDLLAVRDEMESLNEVFTDPDIVKVFHGADSDIVWLQQDFNLYIVNLFDTFHASKLLEFPRHGLANLLEMYCDFIPDKRYQLADWRIRPLPQEMLKYARSDTHFLLYIYDNLRNALLDRSQSQARSRSPSPTSSPHATPARELLYQSLERSAETSLRVYSKEPYDAEEGSGSSGWDTLAKKWNKGALMTGGPGVGISALQREVYKSVHSWRERIAREEDESTRYVMQNHVLFTIAEQPPADMATLLAIFRSSVPPVVKKRAKELLGVIREAVKRALGSSRVDNEEKNPTKDQNGSNEAERMKTRQTPRDAVMLDAEIKNLEQGSANIWGRGTHKTAPLAPHSSLLGPSKSSNNSHVASAAFTTSVSTLFGNTGSKILASNIKTVNTTIGQSRTHAKDLVAKINRSFLIASTAPQVVSATREQVVSEATANEKVDELTGMQIEIPYVPAAQRTTKRVEVVESDTIITVGQSRQKRKRKAGEVKEDMGSDTLEDTAMAAVKINSKTEVDETGTSGVEPFDFADVPNILDDNPDTEDRKKKRQRKQNKGGTFYGDFPAPPKAYSELKSGNQSHTFK